MEQQAGRMISDCVVAGEEKRTEKRTSEDRQCGTSDPPPQAKRARGAGGGESQPSLETDTPPKATSPQTAAQRSSGLCAVCAEAPFGLMVNKALLRSLRPIHCSFYFIFLFYFILYYFIIADQVRCGSCQAAFHSPCARRSGGSRTASGQFRCKRCEDVA